MAVPAPGALQVPAGDWLSTGVLSRTRGWEGSPMSSVQQKCRSPSLAARRATEDLPLEVQPQARSSRSTLGIGSRQ